MEGVFLNLFDNLDVFLWIRLVFIYIFFVVVVVGDVVVFDKYGKGVFGVVGSIVSLFVGVFG